MCVHYAHYAWLYKVFGKFAEQKALVDALNDEVYVLIYRAQRRGALSGCIYILYNV